MAHMKIMSIVGARPNFVKMAPLIRKILKSGEKHILVHTGQHYDRNMSEIFLEELSLPPLDHYLHIGSGPHGQQTGRMLEGLEKVMMEDRPDMVIVPGDTNTTIAGALAAVKLGIRTAHLEAGLRSFDRRMPEEINRIAVDHISDLLFVPTEEGMQNLKNEGLTGYLVGDTMVEACLQNAEIAADKYRVPENYYLATIHRPGNTDHKERLEAIFSAFRTLGNVILPLHPRTAKMLEKFGISTEGVDIRKPMGYLEFLAYMRGARAVITDSGGVQKEAMLLHVPEVTVRPNTEWTETIELGWNVLSEPEDILEKLDYILGRERKNPDGVYGDGRASERILEILKKESE